MAFPGNGTRYVLGGTLPGGERFSTGVYAPAFDESVSMQTVANNNVQSNSLLMGFLNGAARGIIHTGCAYTTLTVYRYGSGRAAVDVGTAAIPNVAGTGAVVHPNQSALCVTLRTTLANRRGRGRMFFPATSGTIANTGLRSATETKAFLDLLGPWLDEINAEVWSTASTSKHRVNRIDADLVTDTIQQRRDRLVSARQTTTIATPD